MRSRTVSRSARDIRETYLSFFESKGHARVPAANLVPQDPTLLFVNAGMVPFKRVFTGEENRPYSRATSSQKVMRVSGKHNDLEEVGRSARHHTLFEMLGNFSFGDYFKQDAILFAWELLTQHYGFEQKDLVVSVFREDDEAADIWEREIGLPPEKIYRLDEEENFWSMGDTGPCGPCTEIHLDRGAIPGVENDDPSSESGRFLEFWNLVFMQYNRDASGVMTPLPKPSVDTGLGLERTAGILQGAATTYETDLFVPLLERAQDLSGVTLGGDADKDVSLKVVADHARAVAFLVGDGVLPSNEGRGYVVRRILRRASRHGKLLGMDEPFLHRVVDKVIDEMGGSFPELEERRDYITGRTLREEERFLETLSKGLSLLESEIDSVQAKGGDVLPGSVVFKLYDTFGFPVDLTQDILRGRDITTDDEGFRTEMDEQRSRSREAWKGSGDAGVSEVYGRIAADVTSEFTGYEMLTGESEIQALVHDGQVVDEAREGNDVDVIVTGTPFYAESGGQVGDCGTIRTESGEVSIADTQRPTGELVVHRGRVTRGSVSTGQLAALAVDAEARAATVRNHTGTHLLHAALREVVGTEAMQKGSLVSPERLRFDFTHDAPLQDEEIERIEDLVNAWIEANHTGQVRQMDYPSAIEAGAIAIFEEKYGDEVRVVKFGDVSTELCGGTHASATGDIGLLKVVSEGGIAAGIRRIEALTGMGALRYLRDEQRKLRQIGDLLRVPTDQAPERIEKLLEDRKTAEKQIADLKRQAATGGGGNDQDEREVAGVKVVVRRVEGLAAKELRGVVDDLRGRLGSGVVLVVSADGDKVSLALGVTKDLNPTLKAGDLVREVAIVVGGKGGGRPDFAQAGGSEPAKIEDAIERLYAVIGDSAA
jgi:alanyl-tRNA synthetase